MLNKIREINKKYDDTVFRMALDHLFRLGSDALSKVSEEELANICNAIIETEPKNSLMTGEVRANILRCACELSKISVWDIFKYIQADMKIDGMTVHPGVVFRLFKDNGKELSTVVLSADASDEAIDEALEAIGKKAAEYRLLYGSGLYSFDADNAIKTAFKDVGIRVQGIEPDIKLYV